MDGSREELKIQTHTGIKEREERINRENNIINLKDSKEHMKR